ncbi:Lrp/AsnC family transcriptional regulator [Methyloraptor flagellatus]|uniref:Lrp/AsnC family transcriptional regulator n=1 Tax=Methyloraptor flagellatus TaxID=3162530 RepID=A0AAU7X9X9_9HYPH
MQLDEFDRRIIRLLRKDGRMTNVQLAREIGLSPSACLRRVQALEANGVIRGYTAIIGGDEADGMIVIVQITLDRQAEETLNQFEEAIRKHPEIRECYLMTGVADYLIRAEVASAADYERMHKEVLSRLPGVARIQSSFAIRSVLQVPGR